MGKREKDGGGGGGRDVCATARCERGNTTGRETERPRDREEEEEEEEAGKLKESPRRPEYRSHT